MCQILKLSLRKVALLVALFDGVGALLTFYWAKYTPFECFNGTCQTPPFWLWWAMLATFGLGVIVPIAGISNSLISSKRGFFSRKESGTPSDSSLIDVAYVAEIAALALILATAVGLFLLHSAYMSFYFACYMPGFVPPGFDCTTVFANGLFADWSAATVLCAVGAVVSVLLRGWFGGRLVSISAHGRGQQLSGIDFTIRTCDPKAVFRSESRSLTSHAETDG